jgi:hypothetical protein
VAKLQLSNWLQFAIHSVSDLLPADRLDEMKITLPAKKYCAFLLMENWASSYVLLAL